MFELPLLALRSRLIVGRRSARALALDSTLPPKAAVEEIIENGRLLAADIRAHALNDARSEIDELAQAQATATYLRKLLAESEPARQDPHGPYQADRLWLGTLLGLGYLVAIVLVVAALLIHGLALDRWSSVLAFVLGAIVAFAAGEWAARSHTLRRAIPALALLPFAVAATWALLATRPHWPVLFVVSATVLAAAAAAGGLVGRARRKVPAIREAEIARNLPKELANAERHEAGAKEAVRIREAALTAELERVGALVSAAVEDYLRSLDDARISQGLLGPAGADAATLRSHAQALIAQWPRILT